MNESTNMQLIYPMNPNPQSTKTLCKLQNQEADLLDLFPEWIFLPKPQHKSDSSFLQVAIVRVDVNLLGELAC